MGKRGGGSLAFAVQILPKDLSPSRLGLWCIGWKIFEWPALEASLWKDGAGWGSDVVNPVVLRKGWREGGI